MNELDVAASAAEVLDPTSELDLADEGFSTPRMLWTITEAEFAGVDEDGDEVEDLRDAERISANITFEAEVDGNDVDFTVFYTFKHPNEQAQQIGRGQLKRLFIAAFGQPKGQITDLIGKKVSAEGGEDNRGFRTLKRLRAPAKSSTKAGNAPVEAVAGL